MSKYGVFSGAHFSIFSPNMGKYGLEKTPYLDTFYVMLRNSNSKWCWKFLTFFSVFWGKFLEFCEATQSYTSALYDKMLSTVLECLLEWNCMTLHSFFLHPCICIFTKINLLKKPLSSLIPTNSYFSVNNVNLVKQLPLHCVKSVQIRNFFWSVFSCIRTKYGDLLRKFPYLIRIQENMDQKKLRIWTLFTQCWT